jgi:hypothetical protein
MRSQLAEVCHFAKGQALPQVQLRERLRQLQEQIESLGPASAEVHRFLNTAQPCCNQPEASRQRPVHIEVSDPVAR